MMMSNNNNCVKPKLHPDVLETVMEKLLFTKPQHCTRRSTARARAARCARKRKAEEDGNNVVITDWDCKLVDLTNVFDDRAARRYSMHHKMMAFRAHGHRVLCVVDVLLRCTRAAANPPLQGLIALSELVAQRVLRQLAAGPTGLRVELALFGRKLSAKQYESFRRSFFACPVFNAPTPPISGLEWRPIIDQVGREHRIAVGMADGVPITEEVV